MKLALLGAGLLGGSTAAAWRRTGVRHVTGFDPDPQTLRIGIERGILDAAAPDVAGAVQQADIVLLACPVGALAATLAQAARAAPAGAILTDVGSTKQAIVHDARALLGSGFARFVPAHPIAGGERPGMAHADAALFEGRRVITTPLADTNAAALDTVESLWRGAGARVERLDPAEHDRIFGAVSHLPHLLAYALVHLLYQGGDGERVLRYAGAGFADFTRIAASDPVMWRDIALANRANLAADVRAYAATLATLERALDAGDGAALEALFAEAAHARRKDYSR